MQCVHCIIQTNVNNAPTMMLSTDSKQNYPQLSFDGWPSSICTHNQLEFALKAAARGPAFNPAFWVP